MLWTAPGVKLPSYRKNGFNPSLWRCVVLVHNLDTLDGLTNGCRGKLVDVEKGPDGQVRRRVVRFHNPEHGRLARMKNPCKKHPGANYIGKITWTYLLGGATAQVSQFPCKGAAATTGHKIQVSRQLLHVKISTFLLYDLLFPHI